MPRTGMVGKRITGDEPDGNSTSMEEKRLERAQEEIGGEGECEEEEGAGGRKEGCIGADRRTSAKVRPFRRGRLRA